MVFRIQVTLSEVEASGLAQLSTRDVRSPREQIRFLIRRELIQSVSSIHHLEPDPVATSLPHTD